MLIGLTDGGGGGRVEEHGRRDGCVLQMNKLEENMEINPSHYLVVGLCSDGVYG